MRREGARLDPVGVTDVRAPVGGVLAKLHVRQSTDVKKGDLLAEIETDKATMELESYKNKKPWREAKTPDADVGDEKDEKKSDDKTAAKPTETK